MNIEPKTFRLVSLGCPKNLVDSEVMAGSLMAAGWKMTPDGPAQVCIVNTCAFVTDAAQESVNTLQDQAQAKAEGEFEFLVAVGCLPEKYQREVCGAVPGVDLEIGTEDFHRIVQLLDSALSKQGETSYLSPQEFLYDHETPRVLSGPPWRAYLKIAEGCDNHCGYCIIGRLRGKMRSRSLDSVIAEARNLADMGVKELILVAQDVTAYGCDIPEGPNLVKLIHALDEVDGLVWVRILYAHPAHLTEEMLTAMAESKKVVHYLDLPIQHASDKILKAMNRKAGRKQIEEILDKADALMPDLVLRTTFIVGLPGETKKAFDDLMDFVQSRRFANVGAFAYSPEQGTTAFKMGGKVPEEEAIARQDALMLRQQEIAAQVWKGFIGQTVTVLVEEELLAETDDDLTHIGRFYGQGPEIDGVTFCRLKLGVKCGDFVDVEIFDAAEYDLFGKQK